MKYNSVYYAGYRVDLHLFLSIALNVFHFMLLYSVLIYISEANTFYSITFIPSHSCNYSADSDFEYKTYKYRKYDALLYCSI